MAEKQAVQEAVNDAVKRATGRAAFDPQEFGDLFGLSRVTIYGEMRAGRIRSFKVGARRLIPASEVERFTLERLAEAQ
jgi:excisionase family DNA binding protein